MIFGIRAVIEAIDAGKELDKVFNTLESLNAKSGSLFLNTIPNTKGIPRIKITPTEINKVMDNILTNIPEIIFIL